MSATLAPLSGDDWQVWANQLLSVHYGPLDYQTVPDEHRGDAGIEGFCVSQGHAYQHYGVEGPLTTAELFEAQRTKMNTDTLKFINNKHFLAKIFGDETKICRWVLFVPRFNSKDIVIHATKRTKVIVDAKLPYVASQFRVMVAQEEDFPIARNMLMEATPKGIVLEVPEPSSEEITSWVTSNNDKVATLQDKLRRLPTLTTDIQRKKFHDDVLKWYLEGQDALSALRLFPDVYDSVVKTKSHQEKFLAMAAAGGASPQETMTSALKELRASLQKEVTQLHNFSADKFAYEAVADWLLRCPLDFPVHN